jgi:two-component system, OmpR family, phosphate regulon sensor histidine kinase PhoR
MDVPSAGIAIVAAAAGIAAGVAIGRRGGRDRLRELTRAVRGLAGGIAQAHVQDGGRPELAALAAAVNETSDRLRRDDERTREDRRVRDLVFSSMQEGVLLVGGDGRTAFANDALVQHLGTRPGSVWSLFPVDLRKAVERVAETGEPVSVEVETGAPARWLRGTAVPATEDASVLLVVRDVTAARRLEAVRRDFVANASHELKTPAASIQATAETILRASADDPHVIPRFAEQLDREAVRLSRIVADLLDLSRLEAGSDLTEHVRLDGIVREEAARLRDSAEAAYVGLDVDSPAVRPVQGSARDLALLVRNLVDNAIRYTKPGGRVQVSVVDGSDGRVVVRVSDTGIGIPTRDLPRVFERFYRVDRARSRETGGTGLGLAIVKHVTENHGGSVTVDSELARGTRIEVRLPPADGVRPR